MIDQHGRLVDSRSYADWMTPSTTPEQLEQELRTAQLHGRWLSDEELAALDEEKRQQIQDQAHRNQLRLRLIVLTGVSLLIPPLWPLAIGLTLYRCSRPRRGTDWPLAGPCCCSDWGGRASRDSDGLVVVVALLERQLEPRPWLGSTVITGARRQGQLEVLNAKRDADDGDEAVQC